MNNYLIGTHTITLHDIVLTVIVAQFGPLVRDSITECDSSSVDTSMLSSIKVVLYTCTEICKGILPIFEFSVMQMYCKKLTSCN